MDMTKFKDENDPGFFGDRWGNSPMDQNYSFAKNWIYAAEHLMYVVKINCDQMNHGLIYHDSAL
jgi:hypothetical protein